MPAFLKLGLLAIPFFANQGMPVKYTLAIKTSHKIFTIGLLQYKGFDSSLVEFIKQETEQFYHCKVIILKPVALPRFAFYAPRNRYKADSLLDYQKRLVTSNIDAIAGLTHKDISTSKDAIPDWGVFGLGMCPGQACVISTYRLSNASKTRAQLKERLVKVVLHEIGHNMGLPHCTNDIQCLMNDAGGTIKQVDQERKWLCKTCLIKLAM